MTNDPQIRQALQTIPWFRELKAAHFDRLLEIAEMVEVAEGAELFTEGDKADDIYIVIEGRVALEIFVPHRGRARILTVEPMDLLGWSSVTPGVHQRTASARAVSRTRLVAFDSEKLGKVCEENCELGYLIMRRVSKIIAS